MTTAFKQDDLSLILSYKQAKKLVKNNSLNVQFVEKTGTTLLRPRLH
jgi:hypothetical protein